MHCRQSSQQFKVTGKGSVVQKLCKLWNLVQTCIERLNASHSYSSFLGMHTFTIAKVISGDSEDGNPQPHTVHVQYIKVILEQTSTA